MCGHSQGSVLTPPGLVLGWSTLVRTNRAPGSSMGPAHITMDGKAGQHPHPLTMQGAVWRELLTWLQVHPGAAHCSPCSPRLRPLGSLCSSLTQWHRRPVLGTCLSTRWGQRAAVCRKHGTRPTWQDERGGHSGARKWSSPGHSPGPGRWPATGLLEDFPRSQIF